MKFEPIAIIGEGCVYPGAMTPDELWRIVIEARDTLTEPEAGEWRLSVDRARSGPDGSDWSIRGGYVRGFDSVFDPGGFALQPEEIGRMDRLVRWMLHAAREALRSAGYDGGDHVRTGAVIGNLSLPTISLSHYAEHVWLKTQAARIPQAWIERAIGTPPHPANRFMSGYPAHLLAQALGLGAGAYCLDAACASSLYAIKLACDHLHDGEADLMLAGAANAADPLFLHTGFRALKAISRTGTSRPFHPQADGLVPAEGCGFVALKRLSDAVRSGDSVLGVIRGIGVSNDGGQGGFLAPAKQGQVRAMRLAYRMSGLTPADIGYVECHATGTQLGDAVEIESMREVFGGAGDGCLPIGSVKGNIGHPVTAAGMAGLLKTLRALREGVYPATLHAREAAASLRGTPFRLPGEAESWRGGSPRRAAVNSFGFGGNNAHLIVEPFPMEAAEASDFAVPIASAGASPSVRTSADRPDLAIVGVGVMAGTHASAKEWSAALFGAAGSDWGSETSRTDELKLAKKSVSVPPVDLSRALPQQLLLLGAAEEAVEAAGELPSERTGIFAGMQCDAEIARHIARVRIGEWAAEWGVADDSGTNGCEPAVDALRLAFSGPLDASTVVGLLPNVPANRLNKHLKVSGPGFTVSSEELSGMTALAIAARALRSGELDAALVGAVELGCETVHQAAAEALLDPHLHRPGDAAVALVLKRLEDARKDGNEVYAVLPSDAASDAAAGRGNELLLGWGEPGAVGLAALAGHPHSASGLLHVAAGALALRHGLRPSFETGKPKVWLRGESPRAARVSVQALGQAAATVRLIEDPSGGTKSPLPGQGTPQLQIYAAEHQQAVLNLLREGRESREGSVRVVIVAAGVEDLEAKRRDAIRRLERYCSGADVFLESPGIYYGEGDCSGETAFVFAGAATAYRGMGGELLAAVPELADAVYPLFRSAKEAVGPMFGDTSESLRLTGDSGLGQDPMAMLGAASYLCQIHAAFSREWLGLRPQSAIGLSSGESNALAAMGAWHDLDGLFRDMREAGVYSRWLAGEYEVLQDAWGESRPVWENWRVNAPEEAVLSALSGEQRVRLTMIHAPGDCLIGGDPAAARRVADRLKPYPSTPLGYDMVVHCPEAGAIASLWRDIHKRPTTPVPGIRFYSGVTGAAYQADSDTAAGALSDMAVGRIDFPRVIRQAWEDGVRVFVEQGPRSACTAWIAKILGDRPHLCVSLDQFGRSGLEQAALAVGKLVAAGAACEPARFLRRLAELSAGSTGCSAGEGLVFPMHQPPVALPDLAGLEAAVRLTDLRDEAGMAEASLERDGAAYGDEAAGAPPTGAGSGNALQAAPFPTGPGRSNGQPPTGAGSAAASQAVPFPTGPGRSNGQPSGAPAMQAAPAAHALLSARYADILRIHRDYLELTAGMQAQAMRTLDAVRLRLMAGAGELAASSGSRPISRFGHQGGDPAVQGGTVSVRTSDRTVHHARPVPADMREQTVRFTREELERLASGRISDVFGLAFAGQDKYGRQVRMPEPPLLLADRVVRLEGRPMSMGLGSIRTETDVRADAWYLHKGRMPFGLMIEAGQADLLLISWLGIDQYNQGRRVYRLLGCELTFHGSLPAPGETLSYDIRVDSHAKHGDVRLFFFQYDCTDQTGRRRMTMRQGQAGFFTDEELRESGGVIWDPSASAAPRSRPAPPAVRPGKTRFTQEEVRAFAAGDLYGCFGEGFEFAGTHTSSPNIQDGRMLLLEEVAVFEPDGGPWGRGYLRAETSLNGEEWFFAGHFKNDPAMPGTLMLEGCVQAMSFYLAGLGYTLHKDGWRFEPAPDRPYRMVCRGQVTPASRHLVYEVFVRETRGNPEPLLLADVLLTVDGLKAFHCRELAVQLVPDFPLHTNPRLTAGLPARDLRAAEAGGVSFDYSSLLACAYGKPSLAFGARYEIYDRGKHVPRLPGPPYHFMTRVTKLGAQMGVPAAGAAIEAEYEIPPDAWYFAENGSRTMPFCVLLEAALQPCGWLVSYLGIPESPEQDAYFRNLDGTAVLRREIGPDAGTLRTRVTLTSLSRMGHTWIEAFRVESFLAGEPQEAVFTMSTVFGHFTLADLSKQVGLGAGEAERQRMLEPSAFAADLRARPDPAFAGGARLAAGKLLMLDRITGFWPHGGKHGLGRSRAEKKVEASEWFFKAHFYQDPVQPGSLGVEAMLQLLQFHMLQSGMADGLERPRFEPIGTGLEIIWKYRGQVTPGNRLIVIDLDIAGTGVEEHGVCALAEASLWVDGLQIYHVSRMGMRLVGEEPSPGGDHPRPLEEETVAEFRFNPDEHPWIRDHRPTYTAPALPGMFMLDWLAAAALKREPGRRIVGASDVRFKRWLIGDRPRLVKTIVRLKENSGEASLYEARLLVGREDGDGRLTRYEEAASGRFRLADAYPAAKVGGVEPKPLEHPAAADDPYENGRLFHGPAFRILKAAAMGANGVSAVLQASGGAGIPPGCLNPWLLDGATHAIPHDELSKWSAGIPDDRVGYPYRITEAVFYGPAPLAGEVRCEVRFEGFAEDASHQPAFGIRLFHAGILWAELRLIEALMPKGRLGRFDGLARRAFLQDRIYVEGMSMSRHVDGSTLLSAGEVRESDWFPGTIAAVYGEAGLADYRELARRVAVKDHIARLAKVHPAAVRPASGFRTAVADARPFEVYPLVLEEREDEVRVVSGQPAFDIETPMAYWRGVIGTGGGWLGEDLYRALIGRFVGGFSIADPLGFSRISNGPVLYLANHQTAVESLLFSCLAGAWTGRSVSAIAKKEHRQSWIGRFLTLMSRYPGADVPLPIIFFDREDRESMLGIAAGMAERLAANRESLLVHVEGTRALSEGHEATRLSAIWTDMAVKAKLPIVPVRFSGGLPWNAAAERLEFPEGFGRQLYRLGRPILPQELSRLSLAERRQAILGAINHAEQVSAPSRGFDAGIDADSSGAEASSAAGPRPHAASMPGAAASHAEAPDAAADREFRQAVRALVSEHGIAHEQAVLLAALAGLERVGAEAEAILRGLATGSLLVPDTPQGRWLGAAAEWLYGPEGPKVHYTKGKGHSHVDEP